MKPDSSARNYRSRMARVVAAIVADPMALHSLDALAAIAHFSPFHFHRLYRALMGETVMETVRRLRLAQAAVWLGEQQRSVTEIALAAGYDSPQAFTRAFRQFSGASPREFQRKVLQLAKPNPPAADRHASFRPELQLLEQGALQVQGMRHHGPAGTIPHTHRHLRQLVGQRTVGQWYGISYGDPEGNGDFTYFAATTLADGSLISDEVEPIEIPAGCYASHTMMGPYTQINASIAALYSLWLPYSGYEPDHRPLLELYHNHPRSVPPEALRTDLLLPVRPLLP